jgi:peroxiredoxin
VTRPIDLILPDERGASYRLADRLREETVVILFYRGDWWPFCNGQLVSCARSYEEFTKRGASVVGVSVDTQAENRAMVEKLRLPFPLLSDPTAAAIDAWDVFDPVGGTHGPIARTSIFVVGRDLSLPYAYVGHDYADRPPIGSLYDALDAVRGATPAALVARAPERGPRAEDAGNPADRPVALSDLIPYLRGGYYSLNAVGSRLEAGPAVEEIDRTKAMLQEFLQAAVATRKLGQPA